MSSIVGAKKGSNMEKESLELLLGQGVSVERIAKRFGKDPSTVSYWMAKYGLEAVGREKHSAKGGIERERLEGLVEAGMTIAEIAAELALSKGTVRHWMKQYGLRTQNSRGRRSGEIARDAKDAGVATVTMLCSRHGETEFFLEGRGYYRCKRCRSEAVARRRRKVKTILVEEAGGRCCICGYDRFIGALAFHHLDPIDKRMPLSARGIAYALGTLREEAKKCALLCANCHAEVENGIVALPIQYARLNVSGESPDTP
jgi:transposase-like protein